MQRCGDPPQPAPHVLTQRRPEIRGGWPLLVKPAQPRFEPRHSLRGRAQSFGAKVIPQKIKTSPTRPMQVLSGRFSRPRCSRVWFTVFTALHNVSGSVPGSVCRPCSVYRRHPVGRRPDPVRSGIKSQTEGSTDSPRTDRARCPGTAHPAISSGLAAPYQFLFVTHQAGQ